MCTVAVPALLPGAPGAPGWSLGCLRGHTAAMRVRAGAEAGWRGVKGVGKGTCAPHDQGVDSGWASTRAAARQWSGPAARRSRCRAGDAGGQRGRPMVAALQSCVHFSARFGLLPNVHGAPGWSLGCLRGRTASALVHGCRTASTEASSSRRRASWKVAHGCSCQATMARPGRSGCPLLDAWWPGVHGRQGRQQACSLELSHHTGQCKDADGGCLPSTRGCLLFEPWLLQVAVHRAGSSGVSAGRAPAGLRP